MAPPEKSKVVAALREQVIEDLAVATENQRRAVEASTHEEAKQEGDKDMRSTEASYLARGLAQRVVELHDVALAFKRHDLDRIFASDEAADVGALVTVEDEDGAMEHMLIVGGGGGMKTTLGKAMVRVVTPQSPLGGALIGRHVDDDVELQTPRGARELVIVGLC